MRQNNILTLYDFGIPQDTVFITKGNFKVFTRYYSSNITKDTPIFRYLKLEYLLEMLIKNQLYVSNRSAFSDLRDKCAIEKIDNKMKSYDLPKLQFGCSAAETFSSRVWKRQDEKDMEALKELSISCWTLDKITDNNIDENILMWKAYRDGDLMCRVGTTIGKLIDGLEPDCDVIISDVCYDGHPSGGLISQFTFHKLPYYITEMEVRLVLCKRTKESQIIKLSNAIEIIDSITVSPFINPRVEDMVISYLKSRFQDLKDKIHPSKIAEYTLC